MIIGTAGHIDHGKSSLVEALTGVRMDRLREERERGITIELNFAPLRLADGRIAGVVDVPGHEDFVRTMVAGASGIDLVLLVIAADEGIMPQTREHLAVAEQLGIPQGIPVLTKLDLVDPDWVELLELEVGEWLASSPVQFMAPIGVSAQTGAGIESLRAGIEHAAASLPPRSADDLFRLPIDRSFSIAGIGTVVTGTAWSGSIRPGDQVLIMPSRRPARVRSVEMHSQEASSAEPGMRVALGLAGVDREDLRRGDVVTEMAAPWQASSLLDVYLQVLPQAPRGLNQRSRVRLHLGTAEVVARIVPLARIEPGQSGPARLVLDAPIVARGGDRFVLRALSPAATLGGGLVIDPVPPRRKGSWPSVLNPRDPVERLEVLALRRPDGMSDAELPILLGLSLEQARKLVREQGTFRSVEGHWLRRETLADASARILSHLERHHAARPGDPGMPLGELRQTIRVASWVADAVLEDLENAKRIVRSNGVARLTSFLPRIAGENGDMDRVIRLVEKAGLTPPSTAELSDTLGIEDLGSILRLAVREHRLEAVERDRHYVPQVLEAFLDALRELGQQGLITPGQLRDRLGLSRKFLIPLLEWADFKGVTVRVGDGRRLR